MDAAPNNEFVIKSHIFILESHYGSDVKQEAGESIASYRGRLVKDLTTKVEADQEGGKGLITAFKGVIKKLWTFLETQQLEAQQVKSENKDLSKVTTPIDQSPQQVQQTAKEIKPVAAERILFNKAEILLPSSPPTAPALPTAASPSPAASPQRPSSAPTPTKAPASLPSMLEQIKNFKLREGGGLSLPESKPISVKDPLRVKLEELRA